jgi:hypothetical protein
MPLLAEPLTPEQSARIERNRLIALERKREFERKRSREKSEGGSAVAEVARSSGLPAAWVGMGVGEGKHRQGANEGERCAKRIAHKGHDSPAARREGCEGGKAVEAKSWMAEERCGEAVEVDDGKKKDQDPDAAKNKWADNVEKRLELGTRQMYGPSTSDHQTDKIKWSGYFEMRNSEMSKRGAALRESHEGAGEVYRNLACSLKNGGSSGPHDGHVDADESKYVARCENLNTVPPRRNWTQKFSSDTPTHHPSPIDPSPDCFHPLICFPGIFSRV